MRSFQDYTIFNSVNPDTLTPQVRKPLPFPLENFEQEILNVYTNMHTVLVKLKAAQENPINHTPARKRRLKKLSYKAKTCLNLIKEISSECQELWY